MTFYANRPGREKRNFPAGIYNKKEDEKGRLYGTNR